jgi:putative SOS response-associated peptidase YedK
VCYSAKIWQDYRKYVRHWGADIGIKEFVRLYWLRDQGAKVRIPKAMDHAFLEPTTEDERTIKSLIDKFNAEQTTKLEQELFKQRKRLADAERTLQTKTTKTATESKRIASEKVEWILSKLASLRSTDLVNDDYRIFPGWHAPVMIVEDGRRVIKPMRYQCRPSGKPSFYDVKFPGTYNARRDNLEGFWREQFGSTHALVVAEAFYENVSRHRLEKRDLAPGEKEENVILEFKPQSGHDMLAACLWSHWSSPGEPDLLSFAAITDEPPAEVAAAGHDRCIIPIKPENVDAWLAPSGRERSSLQAVLEDRERPYYEHRLAA